jgi:hypothetical protein
VIADEMTLRHKEPAASQVRQTTDEA